MSSTTSPKKASKLSGSRYKLVVPCDAYRDVGDLGRETFKQSPVEDSAFPSDQAIKQVKSPQFPEKQRVTLPPLKSQDVKKEINVVKQYLLDIGIPTNMQNLTAELLRNNILPYNPYPGYIQRYKRLAERFHTSRTPLNELKRQLDVPVQPLQGGVLFGVKVRGYNVWGLEHIIAHINPGTIEGYRDLVTKSTLSSDEASSKSGQQITVFVSLFGPAIFNNSFNKHSSSIDVKATIMVTAPEFQVAAKTFSNVIMEDLKLIHAYQIHILELLVAVEDRNRWINRSFSYTELLPMMTGGVNLAEELERVVIAAAVAKKRVSLNLLAEQSTVNKTYVLISKVYDLLFLQTPVASSKTLQGRQAIASVPPRLILSTLPYQAILEGIFLDRSMAELYLTTFKNYYSPPSGVKSRKAGLADPLHPSILNPLAQAWQMKIASEVLEHIGVPLLHYMLLLHLAKTRTKSFSKHSENDLVIQIARFFRGTAARFHSLLQMQKVIEMMQLADDNVGTELLASYRATLLEILETDLSSRSSEMKLLRKMAEITIGTTDQPLSNVSPKKFKQLSHSVSLITMGLIEDAIMDFPAIMEFKNQLSSLFPHLNPPAASSSQSRRQHGIKNSAWINVDAMKVNKPLSVANSPAPKEVAVQYTVMQYCVDMRLDQIWQEYLRTLLLEKDYLPPNPYPLLISLYRRASMSVQCFFEPDTAVFGHVIQKKMIAVQRLRDIFNVTTTSAFGTKTSLSFLNMGGFRQAVDIATKVVLSPPGENVTGFPLQIGAFQAIVCSGLEPPATWYGTLYPFLRSLDLVQYCFLIAPQSQLHFVSTSLAQRVLLHLQSLRSRKNLLHQVHFGDVCLNLNALASSDSRFESEFAAAVGGNQIISLSFFHPLEWRYVLVKMRLLIYFVERTSNRLTPMFSHTSSNYMRRLTIYLNPDDANYCVRSAKPLQPPSNEVIQQALSTRDWTQLTVLLTIAAQSALTGTTTTSGTEILDVATANSILAYCYRYYNGIPGQMDYVMSMNSILDGILEYAIDILEERRALTGGLQRELVEKMFDEYICKLNEVILRRSSLAPAFLPYLLSKKLKSVAFRSKNSNAMFIKYDKDAVSIMREIQGYTVSLRDALAEDLFNASSSVQRYLKSL